MSSSPAQHIEDLFRGKLPAGGDWLAFLIKSKLDELPVPGGGSTLERWRALAAVGQFDLSLTKLYEGHTDALAIIHEIGNDAVGRGAGAWGVWAAEAPGGRAVIHASEDGGVRLSGTKHWCSGAVTGDHALLTAWEANDPSPHLIALDLAQPGILVDCSQWKALGMAGSLSATVAFDGARGSRIGKSGEYLNRPGFWQGAAGIAACWYGGAVGIGLTLRNALLDAAYNHSPDYKLVCLGKVELAIAETAGALRQAAAWIDDNPRLDASHIALTVRLSAERCAKLVIDEVGKAVGATPFCLDENFAKAVADLPVFIRQSHADRDYAALGERSLKREAMAWTL